jgi:hypothetical protein
VLHQFPDELDAAKITGPEWGWISVVFAAVRFANPSHRVKRCEPRTLIIRISARLEQSQRKIEMTVLNCQDQRAGSLPRTFARGLAGLHGLVHVRSRFQQGANHLGPAFARGEKQRCESGVGQRRAKVRASLDQQFNNRSMAIRCGPHQGRLPSPFLRIHIRAARKQRVYRADFARACGGHQSRFLAAKRCIRVSASRQ